MKICKGGLLRLKFCVRVDVDNMDNDMLVSNFVIQHLGPTFLASSYEAHPVESLEQKIWVEILVKLSL